MRIASTAIKKSAPAGVNYKGSAASIGATPTVRARSQSHAINQRKQRLADEQKVLSRELQREHNYESLEQKIQGQAQLGALQTQQRFKQSDLKLEQQYDLDAFKLHAAHERTKESLNVATVAAEGQVAMARTRLLTTTVNQLVNLSTTLYKQHAEQKELDAKSDAYVTSLLGPDPNADGKWDQAEIEQRHAEDQMSGRLATESAIRKVAKQNALLADELGNDNRKAYANKTELRRSNLEFGESMMGRLGDFIMSESIVNIPGRGPINFNQVETLSELQSFLKAGIAKEIIHWAAEEGGTLDTESISLIREKLDKAYNYHLQLHMPKIIKRKQDWEHNVIKSDTTAALNYVSDGGNSIPLELQVKRHFTLLKTSSLGLSNTAANKQVVEDFIEIAKNLRNVEVLQQLLEIQKVDGQKGTEYKHQYGGIINDAIVDIQNSEEAFQKGQADVVLNNMHESLFELGDKATAQDRSNAVYKAIDELNQIGPWGQRTAFELQKKVEELSSPGGMEANERRLRTAILDGTLISQHELNKEANLGFIDTARLKSLSGLLENKSKDWKIQNPQVKSLATTTFNAIKGQFLENVGLKKDITGATIDPYTSGGAKSLIEAWKGDQYLNLVEIQFTRFVNELVRINPDLASDPMKVGELLQLISKESKIWIKDNVTTEGAPFYVRPKMSGLEEIQALNKSIKSVVEYEQLRVQDINRIIENPWSQKTIYSNTDLQPLSLYETIEGADQIAFAEVDEEALRLNYNPIRKDKVFSAKTLDEILAVWQEGGIHPQLQKVSDMLKDKPINVLNTALASYQRDSRVSPLEQGNIMPSVFSPISPEVLLAEAKRDKEDGAPMNALEGARYLMRVHQMPHKGAAFLAGNIQQESTWQGQKQWGEVQNDGTDRNGGLVSWANDYDRKPLPVTRLDDAETALGMPITQASDAKQLDYMIEEMKNSKDYYFREAYKIFMNPWSTNRQLMKASYYYFIYGDEGRRFEYAQQTLDQLLTPPPIE